MRLKPLTLLITGLCSLSLGCQSSQPTSLSRSLHEYENSQWLLCEMWAEKSIADHEHIDEAQYMMGLCEFQLERLDSAQRWFELAATSSNPDVNGKATAMLGIIVLSEGDYETAAVIFSNAAIYLVGKDQQEARSRAASPPINNTHQSATDFFTLQFGAFREKENAQAKVATLTKTLQNTHLGKAWIAKETDRLGRVMYLVQAGRFSSRIAASSRKKRGDLPQCIVTASR